MFDISSRVVELLGVGLTQSGDASLSGGSELLNSGSLRRAQANSNLTVESHLSATALGTFYVTMTADLGSSVSGDANATFRGLASSMSSQTVLDSDGTLFYGGNAALTAATTVSAAGVRKALGDATQSADGSLDASGTRRSFSEAALSSDATASLGSAPVRIRYGEAALEGDLATVDATAYVRRFGESAVSGGAVTFTATPGTVYRLVLATAERAITDDYLLKRYPIDVGLSLIIKDGVVTEVETPSQTELAEADFYFLGGRNNPITPAQRATLVAAGFGSYIQED